MITDVDFNPDKVNRLRAMGHEALVVLLLDRFQENGLKRIESACRHGADGNGAELHRQVHMLKSSAGQLGLQRIQDLSEEIERLAEEEGSSGVSPLLAELRQAFDHALPIIKSQLDRGNS